MESMLRPPAPIKGDSEQPLFQLVKLDAVKLARRDQSKALQPFAQEFVAHLRLVAVVMLHS
jgi:hypothetical protein